MKIVKLLLLLCLFTLPALGQEVRARRVKPLPLTPAQEAVARQISRAVKECPCLPPGYLSREQLAADLVAIAYHESGLRPAAKNGRAKGCFQYMPKTLKACNAKGWGRGDWRRDPAQAARVTIKLMTDNARAVGGGRNEAILGHNIGAANLLKIRGKPKTRQQRILAQIDHGHAKTYLQSVKLRSAQLHPVVSKYLRQTR